MALRPNTKHLDEKGRSPGVTLEVFPFDSDKRPYAIERFNTYTFSNSIIIPVDTFTFVFKAPANRSIEELILEGDQIQLTCAKKPLSTGYVDAIEIATSLENGTIVTVHGRDMMGTLEDNDAVNPDASMLWANTANVDDVVKKIVAHTRLEKLGYQIRNIPPDVKSLFATNPGESKLAALQRFLDPENAIAWTSATGQLVLGRPSFDAEPLGTLGMRALGKGKRASNVLEMSVRRASGQIPNGVLSIWTGNEAVQVIHQRAVKINQAEGPARLYRAGHRVYRTIVTSAPDANDTKSGLTEVQRIISQGANYLDSLAARELARENINELIVTCTVPGHLNERDEPYRSDTCYNIVHDVAGVDRKMYLFSVEYALSEDGGQLTYLSFCNLNTIVAGTDVVDTKKRSINPEGSNVA